MSSVIVLDNGGGYIKAGRGGDSDPLVVTPPNCIYKPLSSKKFLHPSSLADEDLTSAAIRRPIDRGYLINSELQREIWANLFTNTLRVTPNSSSLLLTEPFFSLPSVQRSTDELVFEDFGFRSLYVTDSPRLVHLYEISERPFSGVSQSQCSLVVDCGFSFTHAAPVFENFTLNYGVKRIDLGGKALTNYLKELVSYRSLNVMDETFIMDDVKEKLCFVSTNVPHDLKIARTRGSHNSIRRTYVLPDGVTNTKGFVKDPEIAKRHAYQEVDEVPFKEYPEVKQENRNTVDLAKNEFDLTNERFLVPEMLFHPADLGINQAGMAECIVRSINSCHPLLHPLLYESITLTGGSTLFPGFAERLEKEVRPLVPDDYRVKITLQENPMVGAWRGGSLLASSPDFEAMCVTKGEYEENGSARCRRRFFRSCFSG